MNVTAESLQVTAVSPHRSVLSLLLCFFFLYVNFVMIFALLRRPVLLESPRYVLFCHLLFIDSLQLTMTICLYIFSVTMVSVVSHVCVTMTLLAIVSLQMSPLNLALMSLERYVAICFPLRHASIATSRATAIAISVLWVLGSLNTVTQLFLFIILENTGLPLYTVCIQKRVLRLQIYSNLNKAFVIVYFVLASSIIIYTYIAVLVTVKSASTNVRKAHGTMLLHLFQFCLCLTSTLFGMISSGNAKNVHLPYILFICLIVFPKFLSPLVYGLKDPTFRLVFRYYFTFGLKTTVRPIPKPVVLKTVVVGG